MSHLPTAQRPDLGGPLGSISSNPSTCTSKNKPHYVWLLVSSQSGLQLSYLRSCLLGHQGPRHPCHTKRWGSGHCFWSLLTLPPPFLPSYSERHPGQFTGQYMSKQTLRNQFLLMDSCHLHQ